MSTLERLTQLLEQEQDLYCLNDPEADDREDRAYLRVCERLAGLLKKAMKETERE